MTAGGATVNIAGRLRAMAEALPCKRAVVFPAGRDRQGRVAYTHLTFAQLEAESDALARGLTRIGIGEGVRTLVMVRPGLTFIALTFGLFKAGAVPILIDPGMGRARLLECIRNVAPDAFIGIGLAHVARLLYRRAFASVKTHVTVGRRWFWGGHTLDAIRDRGDEPFPMADTRTDTPAAILFTTGSTGPAKGVDYTHGIFDAQSALIQKTYGMDRDDIDLPTFPLFALFSVALGMTAVIPDMDPTRPGHVDPRRIIEAIHNQGCTFSFGSPALWMRVARFCADRGIRLPTLKKILMAGAPVPPALHEILLTRVLPPDAQTHTPYGATESLPVTNMTGAEVLAETGEATKQGKGVCVGRPVPGVDLKILALTDAAIPEWDEALVMPAGAIGEITVTGPNVTQSYHNRPDQTALSKIRQGSRIWHRIGDLGFRDGQGRIWVCGRKSHRVETADGIFYTLCVEAVFNNHPNVRRSALVGIGKRPQEKPVLILEPETMPSGQAAQDQFKQEVLALGAEHPQAQKIEAVLLHESFPVDIRHNAKIFREKLKAWAAEQLDNQSKQ